MNDVEMVLGIDPGQKGGAAVFRVAPDRVQPWTTYPMPVTSDGAVDVGGIQQIILENRITRAVIEQQVVMGRQSGKGNMTIGENMGRIKAVLEICDIPYEAVTPRVWQKHFGINRRKTRDTKEMAIELCDRFGLPVPTRSGNSNSPLNDGISDAWLIAKYGVEKLVNVKNGS